MRLRSVLLILIAGAAACTVGGGSRRVCRDPLVGAEADASDDGGAGARTCQRGERVFVCDVSNARDLVGTPVGGGQAVACGAVYRGGPLTWLSSSGCLAFANLGIKTVVDLRTDGERAANPEAACVSATATVVPAPMPIPYSVSPAEYIADLNAAPSVAAVFAALGDPTAYPVYVHCTFGRDRTGVMAALILAALGATRTEILGEYLLSQAEVGAAPGSLTAVLDEIDRRGGIDAVLTAAGVTAEQLTTLRTRAVAP